MDGDTETWGRKMGRFIGIQTGRRIGEMHGVQREEKEVETKRGAEKGQGEREKAIVRG
jgi:hypothetical protein